MGIGFRFYLGFRVEGRDNLPKNGSFIIVSNHASHLDTAAILVALGHRSLGVHPMAATDYWFTNATRKWFVTSCLGAIPFDRELHVAESLALAAAVLEQEQALLFFPEGGRTTTGKMQPFKRGIGLLVLAAGVPVVPVRVEGTFAALPKGRTFLRRHPVLVRFGPPISPDGYLQGATKASAMEASRRVSTDLEKAVEALA
jgi:1-acyl-sn-glycerol-3-phosphate acyltransferase